MKRTNLLTFIAAIFIAVSFLRQTLTAQVTSQEIDEIVENALSTFNVAGVAVAVVKDGKIMHEKGYGVQSVETKEKVNEHTNFGIASNSKAFTSVALAILVEDGKITWQDRVIDHIPEFKMYNSYVTENFNIQDLLTHRSGLGLGIGDLMFFPDGADFTIDDIVSSFQHFKPVSAFRTKFDYDNLLYLVAGELIARVSGMSWEKFIEERIFKPLQMDNSYASVTYTDGKSNIAKPHLNEGDALVQIEPERWDPSKINGAAGGIYSNVNDLAQWMMVQLNHGNYDDDTQLFSPASQNEMWKLHTLLPVNRDPRYNSHFRGYGLGWGLTDAKGNMVVSHTGGLIGMLSKTLLIPDLDLGIVVLTNTWTDGSGVFVAVTQALMDKYLGLEELDWVDILSSSMNSNSTHADSVVAKVWETVDQADDGRINVEDYTGTYEDVWFGKVEIYKNGDQLFFKSLRSPKLTGSMSYYKANTFVVKWEDKGIVDADAFVIFALDEEGKGQSIKMKGISPAIDFSYDFQDLDLKRSE